MIYLIAVECTPKEGLIKSKKERIEALYEIEMEEYYSDGMFFDGGPELFAERRAIENFCEEYLVDQKNYSIAAEIAEVLGA